MKIKYTKINATEFAPEYIKRENENGSISFIPTDLHNADYQEYLAANEAINKL